MRQSEQAPRRFKDFLEGRQNRLRPSFANAAAGRPAMAGASVPFAKQNSQTVDNNPHIMQASQPGVIPGGLGQGTGVKERPTRTIEPKIKEPSIPQQDIDDANAGRLRENKLIGFIKRHPAVSAGIGVGSVTVGGVVAAGINAELNNRTEAHQNITAPTASEGPFTFDLNADSGIIGPQNSIVLTQETDPEAVAPKAPTKEDKSTAIPLSIVNPDGTVPDIKYERTRSSISYVDNNQLTITDGIQPGMIVGSPIEGIIYYGVAGRFARTDGLLGRPGFFLEGIDKDGKRVYVSLSTASDVLPLLKMYRIEDYPGQEPPKVQVHIGGPIFQFTNNIRKNDQGSQLTFSNSGVGELNIKTKDGKAVFVAQSPQPVSQKTP